jgi:hypothetical protein
MHSGRWNFPQRRWTRGRAGTAAAHAAIQAFEANPRYRFTKCEEEPLLPRHVTPLTRRNVVYFCSGAYSTAWFTVWVTAAEVTEL